MFDFVTQDQLLDVRAENLEFWFTVIGIFLGILTVLLGAAFVKAYFDFSQLDKKIKAIEIDIKELDKKKQLLDEKKRTQEMLFKDASRFQVLFSGAILNQLQARYKLAIESAIFAAEKLSSYDDELAQNLLDSCYAFCDSVFYSHGKKGEELDVFLKELKELRIDRGEKINREKDPLKINNYVSDKILKGVNNFFPN